MTSMCQWSVRFNVSVECEQGYEGSAKATPCTEDKGFYTLSGCSTPGHGYCIAGDTLGYAVTERNLAIHGFNVSVECEHDFDVSVECAQGYEGSAKADPCTEDKGFYILSGCSTPEHGYCIAGDTLGYAVTERNLAIHDFNVSVECYSQHGYRGSAKATPCTEDKGFYTLSGCYKPGHGYCMAGNTSAYVVYEKNLSLSNFQLLADCDGVHGYTGTATVAPCTADKGLYMLSGCCKMDLEGICSQPVFTEGYELTMKNLGRCGFDASARCAQGYQGFAKVSPCRNHGEPFSLSGCTGTAGTCTTPVDTAGYVVTESSKQISTFDVEVACDSDHTGSPFVIPCSKGGEAYKVGGCCTATSDRGYCQAGVTVGAIVTETSLSICNFNVSADCANDLGYTGTANITPCTEDGGLYTISGCVHSHFQCVAPTGKDTEAYTVTEYSTLSGSAFMVSVQCAVGYHGTPVAETCVGEVPPLNIYKLSGCTKSMHPRYCRAPDDTKGYTTTEVDLSVHNFNVSARCVSGFKGIASVSPCSEPDGFYSLTGCEKIKYCLSPTSRDVPDLPAYDIHVHELDMDAFNVTVSCAEYYKGSAAVVPCRDDGLPFHVSNCRKKLCRAATPGLEGYTVIEHDLSILGFRVSPQCADFWDGRAQATACTEDGGDYNLSGCELFCAAPADTHPYLITEHDVRRSLFNVTAQCAPGFKGSARVSRCPATSKEYKVKGCEIDYAVMKCLTPLSSDKDRYEVSEHILKVKGFNVSVACAPGFEGNAFVLPCTEHLGFYTLGGCCQSPGETGYCGTPMDTGYVLSEVDKSICGFDVHASCAEGYGGEAKVTQCRADGEMYRVEGCLPCSNHSGLKGCYPSCKTPADTSGYVVSEHNLSFSAKFHVTAACKRGYFGKAVVKRCSSAGGFYSVSGCTRPSCRAPADKSNYEVVEHSLALDDFRVNASCAPRLVGTAVVTKCSHDSGRYKLSGCCNYEEEAGRCHAPIAAGLQGYDITEKNFAICGFDITATCSPGFEGVAQVLPCTEDKGDYKLTGCKPSPLQQLTNGNRRGVRGRGKDHREIVS
eukprot:TRINITY_DN9481_c0_g1_i7.p1 TRINITY_DN9481_c0_g1~~TRINITY_DN9481_c0_g1_i7.p1  ORF type:complete len:1062 (+),score=129.95 TRINITY_DN9481_c0_g1_i7:145-3330(+)